VIITILRHQYDLEFCERLPRILIDGTPQRVDGYCDPPHAPGKQILIRSTLGEQETLDTLIHEMLHAAGWHIDEEFVEQFAADAAAVLWKLGYRRCSDGLDQHGG
jgi:hypothetical protein